MTWTLKVQRCFFKSHEEKILTKFSLKNNFSGQKLRDTFLWNKNDTMLSPDQFAEVLCDDLDLNPLHFVPAIAAAINQQIGKEYVLEIYDQLF